MKYLKRYESLNNNVFYLIPRTDKEYLELVAFKLKFSDEQTDALLRNNTISKENSKIYLPQLQKEADRIRWTEPSKEGYDWYIGSGLEYKGELIITDEDKEDFEFYKNRKKFNI